MSLAEAWKALAISQRKGSRNLAARCRDLHENIRLLQEALAEQTEARVDSENKARMWRARAEGITGRLIKAQTPAPYGNAEVGRMIRAQEEGLGEAVGETEDGRWYLK
jgi:hypothetical protein